MVSSSTGSMKDTYKEELLWTLVEQTGEELSADLKKMFYQIYTLYVFASSTADLGKTDRLQHSIPTWDTTPIRQPVRRVPPPQREEIRDLLNDMLERNVIEPSSSLWASPIILVRKKDATTRFCVNYRKVNEVTRKDAYPLPRINSTLDMLHVSQWFSTLDLFKWLLASRIGEN